MRYSFEISSGVVFTKFEGILDIQSAKHYQDTLFYSPDLKPEVKKGLMDFRGIENLIALPRDYKILIDREVAARRSGIVNEDAVVAIVVSNEIHKIAFKLYSILIKEFGVYYKVFTDLREALGWLDLEIQTIPDFINRVTFE